MAMLQFERGDVQAPTGHSFLYFDAGDGQIVATYLVVPPIPIDLAKYLPPLLASSLGAGGLIADTTFVPIPPAPEPFDLATLRQVAEIRGDDVLFGGEARGIDTAAMIARVAEIGAAYAQAYQEAIARASQAEPEEPTSRQVDALLYSLLSEGERVQELARRIGTLRYAVESGDATLTRETLTEMRAISAYLSEEYRAAELIEAAGRAGPEGARLAQLFIERAYHVARRDHAAVAALDDQIASLYREARGQ